MAPAGLCLHKPLAIPHVIICQLKDAAMRRGVLLRVTLLASGFLIGKFLQCSSSPLNLSGTCLFPPVPAGHTRNADEWVFLQALQDSLFGRS